MSSSEPFATLDPAQACDVARASARLCLDLLIQGADFAEKTGRYREAAEAAADMARGLNALARAMPGSN